MSGYSPQSSLRAVLCAGAAIVIGVLAGLSATGVAATLPDGRAYELVSPHEKNGADVLAMSARTRASADGEAIAFASFVGFGDVVGIGTTTDYVSQRSPSGWTTRGITPGGQDPLPFIQFLNGNPMLYELYSEDLSAGVVRTISPVGPAPNAENVRNLYRRTGLRDPGTGSYRLLTSSATPLAADDSYLPWTADASADLSHVIFESTRNLTPDATGSGTKLFESVDGNLRLAGILPDGTPAESSAAGRGAFQHNYTPDTISRDGSRIVFTSPVTSGDSGQLYLRERGATTVRINESERQAPDPVPGDATFWAATPDQSLIFFTSPEQLTEDDQNLVIDLYRYDARLPHAAPGNLTRLSVDTAPGDEAGGVTGVIGTSADGAYVYFIARGQLVGGAPEVDWEEQPTVYLAHGGSLRFVGALGDLGTGGGAPELYDREDNLSIGGYYGARKQARVAPDGRTLVFLARSGELLTGYDHGTCLAPDGTVPNEGDSCTEVYVYDAAAEGGAGKLACASCRPDGAPASSDAFVDARANSTGAWRGRQLNRAISDDGRRVFFTTGEALVPDDRNGRSLDAYQYDVDTGAVHLLSGGRHKSDAYFMDASASGRDAFFVTREPLVPWDADDLYDLYDARIGGGVPGPPEPGPACEGEECRDAGGSRYTPPAPASATLRSLGNVPGDDAGAVPAFHVYALTAQQRSALARGRAVRLRVRVSERGSLHVRVVRLGSPRARTIARASRRVAFGGVVGIRVKLPRRAVRTLRDGVRMRVRIVVGYSKVAGTQRVAAVLRRDTVRTRARSRGRR